MPALLSAKARSSSLRVAGTSPVIPTTKFQGFRDKAPQKTRVWGTAAEDLTPRRVNDPDSAFQEIQKGKKQLLFELLGQIRWDRDKDLAVLMTLDIPHPALVGVTER
jgi:hypothetical protein